MEKKFDSVTFRNRLKSMLSVDVKRIFLSKFFYIMLGISLAIPILILVMTTMMDGTISTNPQTGEQTVMEGFKNLWQIFGSVSSSSSNSSAGMSMDLVSMCNINMMYFAVAVQACIFISDDFRSGYAKNLFTVRAKKSDYVISKTIIGFISASLIFISFFIGALIGGGISGLPTEMTGFNTSNFIACLLSKIFISLIFVAVCVLASVIGKQKAWLSIILSLGFGMLFFSIIPMVTPLDSTFVNVALCLIVGILFSLGLGTISNQILKKTNII